jgi:hypothetical protein
MMLFFPIAGSEVSQPGPREKNAGVSQESGKCPPMHPEGGGVLDVPDAERGEGGRVEAGRGIPVRTSAHNNGPSAKRNALVPIP